MRITITLPDEVGEEIKRRADNVSGFVAEAVVEYLAATRRRAAREQLRKLAGSAEIEPDAYDMLHAERKSSDRT